MADESTSRISRLFAALLGDPGFNVHPDARRRVVLTAALVVLALVAVLGFGLGRWSDVVVAADHPAWETALQARVMLFRAKVAVSLAAVGLAASYGAFQVLDRSRLGQRLFHWSEQDHEGTQTAKTFGAAVVFGLLALGLLTLFSRVLA